MRSFLSRPIKFAATPARNAINMTQVSKFATKSLPAIKPRLMPAVPIKIPHPSLPRSLPVKLFNNDNDNKYHQRTRSFSSAKIIKKSYLNYLLIPLAVANVTDDNDNHKTDETKSTIKCPYLCRYEISYEAELHDCIERIDKITKKIEARRAQIWNIRIMLGKHIIEKRDESNYLMNFFVKFDNDTIILHHNIIAVKNALVECRDLYDSYQRSKDSIEEISHLVSVLKQVEEKQQKVSGLLNSIKKIDDELQDYYRETSWYMWDTHEGRSPNSYYMGRRYKFKLDTELKNIIETFFKPVVHSGLY